MNYAIELLEEQKELLTEEIRFAEGEELDQANERMDYVVDALNKLTIPSVVGSALVEIENPYIEDANNVLRGDIYTVDGRVSKCWILETDFDNIKCTHN